MTGSSGECAGILGEEIHHKDTKINTKARQEIDWNSSHLFVVLCASFVSLW
jgi:hypothetical protein